MGSRLRVFLTTEQDKTLFNLRTADLTQKVKDRAEVIRLDAHGWYVEKITTHFNCAPKRRERVYIRDWSHQYLMGTDRLYIPLMMKYKGTDMRR